MPTLYEEDAELRSLWTENRKLGDTLHGFADMSEAFSDADSRNSTPPNEKTLENSPMPKASEKLNAQDKKNIIAQIDEKIGRLNPEHVRNKYQATTNDASITIDIPRKSGIKDFIVHMFSVQAPFISSDNGKLTITGSSVFSIKHRLEFYKRLDGIPAGANPFYLFPELTSSNQKVYAQNRQLKIAHNWFKEKVEELTTAAELKTLKKQYKQYLETEHLFDEDLEGLLDFLQPVTNKIYDLEQASASSQATSSAAAAASASHSVQPASQPRASSGSAPIASEKINAQDKKNIIAQIDEQISQLNPEHIKSLSLTSANKVRITIDIPRRFGIHDFLLNKFGLKAASLKSYNGKLTVKGSAIYSIKRFLGFYKSLEEISLDENPFYHFQKLTSPSTDEPYHPDFQLKFASNWFEDKVEELTTVAELTKLKEQYTEYVKDKFKFTEDGLREDGDLVPAIEKIADLEKASASSQATSSAAAAAATASVSDAVQPASQPPAQSSSMPVATSKLSAQDKKSIVEQIERQIKQLNPDHVKSKVQASTNKASITIDAPRSWSRRNETRAFLQRKFGFTQASIHGDRGKLTVTGAAVYSIKHFLEFYKRLEEMSVDVNPFYRFQELTLPSSNNVYSKPRQLRFADNWFDEKFETLRTAPELKLLKEQYKKYLKEVHKFSKKELEDFLESAVKKIADLEKASASSQATSSAVAADAVQPASQPQAESSSIPVATSKLSTQDKKDILKQIDAQLRAIPQSSLRTQIVASVKKPSITIQYNNLSSKDEIKRFLTKRFNILSDSLRFSNGTLTMTRSSVFTIYHFQQFYTHFEKMSGDVNPFDHFQHLTRASHGHQAFSKGKQLKFAEAWFLEKVEELTTRAELTRLKDHFADHLNNKHKLSVDKVRGYLKPATEKLASLGEASASAQATSSAVVASVFDAVQPASQPPAQSSSMPIAKGKLSAQDKKDLVAKIDEQIGRLDPEHVRNQSRASENDVTITIDIPQRFGINGFLLNKFGFKAASLKSDNGKLTVTGSAVFSIKHLLEFYKNLDKIKISADANPFYHFQKLTSPSTGNPYHPDFQLKFASNWFEDKVEELTTRAEISRLKNHFADYLNNKHKSSNDKVREYLAPATEKLATLPVEAAPAPAAETPAVVAESTPPPTQNDSSGDTVMVDLVGPDSALPPSAEPNVVTFEQLMQSVTQQVGLMPREFREPLSSVNSFVNQRVALAFDCQGADQAALIKNLLLKHLGFQKDWSTFNETTSKLTISAEGFYKLSIAKEFYDEQAASRAFPRSAPTAASLAASSPVFTTPPPASQSTRGVRPRSEILANESTDRVEPRAIAAPAQEAPTPPPHPIAASSSFLSTPGSGSVRRRRARPEDLTSLSDNGLKRLKLMLRNEELNREEQKVEAERQRLQAEQQKVAQELEVIDLSDDESPAPNETRMEKPSW